MHALCLEAYIQALLKSELVRHSCCMYLQSLFHADLMLCILTCFVCAVTMSVYAITMSVCAITAFLPANTESHASFHASFMQVG